MKITRKFKKITHHVEISSQLWCACAAMAVFSGQIVLPLVLLSGISRFQTFPDAACFLDYPQLSEDVVQINTHKIAMFYTP